MERFTALMSDGRSGKLDLLLHLLANLPRPLLLLGPAGAGKTTLLRQVQSRAHENWSTCYVAASATLGLEQICEQMLQCLRPDGKAGAEIAPEARLEAELAQLSRKGGRLILLLDDAGSLLPGLLGAVCQFARLHADVQFAFALRPEDLAQKATSDPLALADAHLIDLSPLTWDTPAPVPKVRQQHPPVRREGMVKAFLSVFKRSKGLSPKSLGPLVLAALAAATAAGFLVQSLWQDREAEHPKVQASPAPVPPRRTVSAAPIPEVQPTADVAQPPASAPPQVEIAAAPPAAEPAPSVTPMPTPPPATGKSPATEMEATMAEKPFAQLISAVPASRAPAYARLLQLWGVPPPGPVGDECAYAKSKALRCLSLKADWQALQTLNRPAVLVLQSGGARRYLALTGMEGGQAIVDINGQSFRTPLTEIQPNLRGDAVILWKPPFDKASIGLHERGETVKWLRERLAVPAPPGADTVFDEQVKARVIAFQKQKGLLADGRAGALTLLHIQLLADAPEAPKLSNPASTP